ncbi:MAG TPA: MmcQ/YjbR family DNA-binding protein [Alphaproteobacteria bacterium]|nr:MmcQ/YjbR family DNA-binding protein [Alphaproteobacteria bacterium]
MSSYIDWVRAFCLTLPHTTEDIQWGNDLLFRISEKIYCVACLEPTAPTKIAFKCTPEKFAELVEIEGIIPAPYMARNHWVALVDVNALRQPEIKELVQNSYQLVLERLPKKRQAELQNPPLKARKQVAKKKAKRR